MIGRLAYELVKKGLTPEKIIEVNPKDGSNDNAKIIMSIGRSILEIKPIRAYLINKMSDEIKNMMRMFSNIEIGDRFSIKGRISYGQDFGFHTGSFNPELQFTVREKIGTSVLKLVAPGFGLKDNYGNGAIYVHIKYFLSNDLIGFIKNFRYETNNDDEDYEGYVKGDNETNKYP